MASQMSDFIQARMNVLEWTVPLALLLSATLYIVYQRFLHPLASIPGPLFVSLSRLWMTKHSWDGEIHLNAVEFHEIC
jgi:hypothetical protein